jgi:hypothetical protein
VRFSQLPSPNDRILDCILRLTSSAYRQSMATLKVTNDGAERGIALLQS